MTKHDALARTLIDGAYSGLMWSLAKASYGVALSIAAVIYVVLRALRRRFPHVPAPLVIAAPVFIVGLLTLPSLPRYQCERDTMSQIRGKDWIRVVSATKLGDVTEPLTWIWPPVGSVTLVMPNDPIEADTFRLMIIRYWDKPTVSIVEPDCTALSVTYSRPDSEGVFRIHPRQKMGDRERQWYCEYDWSRQREALRQEALRQIERDRDN